MEIVTLGFLNIVVFAAKGLAVTIPTPSDHFYVPVTYDKKRLVNSLQAAPLSELIKLESTSFHRVTTNKGGNVIFYHSKEIKEKLTSPRKSRSTDSQLPKEQTIEENRKSQVCSLELTVDPFVWSFALRKHCQNEKNAMEDVHAMLRDHVSVLNQVFKDVRFPPYTNTQTKQDHVRIQFEIHSIAIYNDSWCGLTSSSICNSSLEYQQVLLSYSDTVIYKRLTENSKATINYPDFENADANDNFLSDDYFNNRHGQYCLSVLFTARELYKTTDEGKIPVNGLSMTAELGNSNGVCKEHNFAFVNLYKDAENPYMPSTLTHLVLAHELAHSLGALHDTGGIECIPEKDGFYLMHNVTVDGKDLNNYRLSPCSVDSIAKILSDPNRTSCFKDRSLSVCGNGLVEVGEECDCGTVCYLDDGCHSSQEENRCLLKYNTDNSNSSVLGVGSIDKTANDTACITEGRDGLCTERLNPWTNGQNTNWLLLVLMSTLCCTVLFSVVALLVWKCRPSVCFHCSSAVKSRHCARVFNASENTTDNLQLPALPNGLSKIPTEDSKTHLLAFYKTGDTVIECAPETFQKV